MSWSNFWHTIRFLQAQQIYYQIRYRLLTPRLKKTVSGEPPQIKDLNLAPGVSRPHSYLGGGRFLFLNKEHDLGKAIDWRAPGLPRLWQYNLHYFDYLRQPDLDHQSGLALVDSWIKHHPVQTGAVGWEPYPLSLRLVNWLNFFSQCEDTPEQVKSSLLLQTINLEKQLEFHIGGNHLWANGKALWLAGEYLQQPRVAELGRKIVLQELDRQFLPDGGHFELSPMYHAILTEDLLDLANLCKNGAGRAAEPDLSILHHRASRALGWLGAIIDHQGEFPLLNDAAYGIAATYTELMNYADRLGVAARLSEVPTLSLGRWSGKNLSGYWVFTNGPLRLIWDTANLGPDYLLGHAHCDMLSLLLDFDGQNILTDTGVSQYDEGTQRQYERGTSAHNTVVLDELEQAELWKSFRVGRRGHPKNFQQAGHTLRCSHTGFEIWQPGLGHERELTFLDNGFALQDMVKGPGRHRFKAFFHFAPGVRVESRGPGDFLINGNLLLKTWGAETQRATSDYCPEFGKVVSRPCLILRGEFRQRHTFGMTCTSFS